MILITFVQESREKILNKLDLFFKNQNSKMTRELYFEMCEQLGQEPEEEKIPPDWEDFPEIIVVALNTFNLLGDRVAAEVGFIGKDYTNLPYFIDMYGVESEEQELFIETLMWLESRVIKDSQDLMKREREKIKRKGRGSKPS